MDSHFSNRRIRPSFVSSFQKKKAFPEDLCVIQTHDGTLSLNTLNMVKDDEIRPYLSTKYKFLSEGYKKPAEFIEFIDSCFKEDKDFDDTFQSRATTIESYKFSVFLSVLLGLTEVFKVLYLKVENVEIIALLNDVLISIFDGQLDQCPKRPFLVLPKGKKTDKKDFLTRLGQKSISIILNEDDVLDEMITDLSRGVVRNDDASIPLSSNIIITSNVENKLSRNMSDKFFTLPGIKVNDTSSTLSELKELVSEREYKDRIFTFCIHLLKDVGFLQYPNVEHIVLDPIKLYWYKIEPKHSKLSDLAASTDSIKLDTIYRNHFVPFTQDIGYSRNITKDEFCSRFTNIMKLDGYGDLISKKNKTTIIVGLSLKKCSYSLSQRFENMDYFNPVQIANKVVF